MTLVDTARQSVLQMNRKKHILIKTVSINMTPLILRSLTRDKQLANVEAVIMIMIMIIIIPDETPLLPSLTSILSCSGVAIQGA